MKESTQKQKEQARLRMQKMRNKKSVTGDSVTKEDVTLEMVPASYVEGIEKYEALPERPRYLKLSDGQVLDRLNQPNPNIRGDRAMQACNESSYNFHPNEPDKAKVKALIKAVKGV